MFIHCPACNQKISLKKANPGRYKSKCKGCGEPLRIVVPEEPDSSPTVKRISKSPVAREPSSATPEERAASASAAQRAKPTSAKAANETSPSQDQTVIIPAADQASTETVAPVEQAQQPPQGSAAEATSAHSQSGSAPAPTAPTATSSIPERLGGYRILDELGRGAMGAVYRARQISLDREVALKTILAQWAKEPRMIARFTREAYAAAQIAHHNVVQIFDLGCDNDTHFFAMEFVKGRPLSDVVTKHGKLDVEVAVSYMLQAARGLQAAHSHGMVHRDVKPANMMISDDGTLKVADLGLVKVEGTEDIDADQPHADLLNVAKGNITLANVALGTAAFMAPEQAEDAATVDHRADIYSLGCTLYSLITGQTPFSGTTALEVITKHRNEPIVRPETVVKNIPAGLSEIVMKMVAKRVEDRPANMGQVVSELEQFLGITKVGSFTPTDDHAGRLVESVKTFNAAPSARIQAAVGYGGPLACGLLGFLTLFVNPVLGLATMTVGVVFVLAYFTISGIRERTDLFAETRGLVARSSWRDWLTWAGGGLLALALAWALGMLLTVLLVIVIGVGLAAAFHFLLDQQVRNQRADSVQTVEDMLRSLRLRGVAESDLRRFVARYSGDNWEPMYEAIFSYQAKLDARKDMERGEVGKRKKRYRSWRDPLFNWVRSRVREQREQHDAKHLQQVEQAGLKATGVSAADAEEQAKQIAAQMVREAMETRTLAMEQQLEVIDPKIAAQEKRKRVKRMLAEARQTGRASKSSKDRVPGLVGAAFGSRMRFVVGCLLLTGCLFWARQNDLLDLNALEGAAQSVIEGENPINSDTPNDPAVATNNQPILKEPTGRTEPLAIPLAGRLFDSFGPGLAGLLLIVSAFVSGARMSVVAIPAAFVAWFGADFGVPGIDAIGGGQATSATIGLGLVVAGFIFIRPKH